jgi:hypothetical protein
VLSAYIVPAGECDAMVDDKHFSMIAEVDMKRRRHQPNGVEASKD